jgi:hypothetical protein
MPSAEARKRRPKYKQYKQVRRAEDFARRLGVPGQVDYRGRLDIANVCNDGLFTASEHGVPMPGSIIVKDGFLEAENEDPRELAYYLPGTGGAPGEIYINAGHPAWADVAAAMRDAYRNHDFSTGDPRHAIMHEMGELAMHQSVGAVLFDPFSDEYAAEEEEFRALGDTGALDAIADAVSDRAIENHSEFVAETFAALLLGRRELLANEFVMGAYTRFGGERIREYDREIHPA